MNGLLAAIYGCGEFISIDADPMHQGVYQLAQDILDDAMVLSSTCLVLLEAESAKEREAAQHKMNVARATDRIRDVIIARTSSKPEE